MESALFTHAPSRRFKNWRAAAFALTAAITVSTATPVFAGAAEFTALNTFLNGGTATTTNRVATATTQQLIDAITSFKTANPKKLNPAIIAGEALKFAGSNAANFGAVLGTTVTGTGYLPITFGTKSITTASAFATDAIKAASSGKGLNVSQVPAFAKVVVTTKPDALTLATSVKASKLAASAVLGGYASNLVGGTAEADKVSLANDALASASLKPAALEISQAIVGTGINAATFVSQVAGRTGTVGTSTKIVNVNGANADKIVVGAVAGSPTQAGAITDAALSIVDIAKTPTAANPNPRLLLAKTSALAGKIAAVADIEQIQKVGEQIGRRIGSVGGLKLAVATPIITTLAKAIVAKPFAASGALRNANKVDELGELAAYMVNAISSSAEFTAVTGTTTKKAKIADKTIIAIIKAVVTSAKTKTPGSTGPLLKDVLEYVVGSVALTVNNLFPSAVNGSNEQIVKSAILTALGLAANQKALAALAKDTAVTAVTVAGYVTAGLNNGTTSVTGALSNFENGTLSSVGLLTDPETNSRNL